MLARHTAPRPSSLSLVRSTLRARNSRAKTFAPKKMAAAAVRAGLRAATARAFSYAPAAATPMGRAHLATAPAAAAGAGAETELVQVTHRPHGVAVVAFNNPSALNAMTVRLGDVFRDRIQELSSTAWLGWVRMGIRRVQSHGEP